ncbi:hypothetical protein PQX77_016785 [Marasmius sp. AFHP31]|nr:hypothetical protein PQX77_016785 [Marasmius sp. AFHP31]
MSPRWRQRCTTSPKLYAKRRWFTPLYILANKGGVFPGCKGQSPLGNCLGGFANAHVPLRKLAASRVQHVSSERQHLQWPLSYSPPPFNLDSPHAHTPVTSQALVLRPPGLVALTTEPDSSAMVATPSGEVVPHHGSLQTMIQETHNWRMEQQKDRNAKKGTGVAYPCHVERYNDWWQANQFKWQQGNLSYIVVPSMPPTVTKVALWLMQSEMANMLGGVGRKLRIPLLGGPPYCNPSVLLNMNVKIGLGDSLTTPR